jgi:mannosyltransferase OCH1-like enzyme
MSAPPRIPPILHQTWKTEDVPERFREAVARWSRLHPHWTHMFWTDAAIEAFVAEHYPAMLPLFRAYPDQIQRVDAVRYMILAHHGGIYSDLDVEPRRNCDELLVHAAFLPPTKPLGVSNDFMGAAAGHPFFLRLVEGLPAAARRWQRPFVPRHFRVLLTTGSLYATGLFHRFGATDGVTVLDPSLYGDPIGPRSLVGHLPGNTWAGPDTYFFLFLARRWKALALAAAGLACAAVAAALLWG